MLAFSCKSMLANNLQQVFHQLVCLEQILPRVDVPADGEAVRYRSTAMIPARSINSRNMISVSIEKKVGVSLQPYFIPVVDVILVSSPCALMPSRLPASRAATRREREGGRERKRGREERREKREETETERETGERERETGCSRGGVPSSPPERKREGEREGQ